MKGWFLPYLGTGCLFVTVGIAGLGAYTAITKPLPAMPIQSDNGSSSSSIPDPKPHLRRTLSDKYYAAVTDRPLFTPSRRPLAQETRAIPLAEQKSQSEGEHALQPAVPEAPPFQLHGTLLTAVRPSALLSFPDSEPEWIQTGTKVQGWHLDAIGDGWVSLTRGEKTFKLELY